jgi:hypothetical protein
MLDKVKTFVALSLPIKIERSARIITSPWRLMPDFLVLGGQKCGTTSLYQYLISHPFIISAMKKQMHFFDNHYEKGVSWYRAHFPSYFYKHYFKYINKRDFITGEATPYYIFHPLAARRAAKFVPNAKFILVIRNPVERAYSHYHHEIRKGTEKLSFQEAIAKEPERLAGEKEKMLNDEYYYSFNYQRYSYLSRGLYAEQLAEWFKYFPKEQFFIVKSEDMRHNTIDIVKQIFDFLDLPKFSEFNLEKDQYYNVGKYDKMDTKMREQLVEYFKPHNEQLYKLLDRDFNWQ